MTHDAEFVKPCIGDPYTGPPVIFRPPSEWEEFERRRSEEQPVADAVNRELAALRDFIAWRAEHEATLRRLWPAVLAGDIAAAEKVLKLTREAAEIFGSR
jgi:hypothetical protein